MLRPLLLALSALALVAGASRAQSFHLVGRLTPPSAAGHYGLVDSSVEIASDGVNLGAFVDRGVRMLVTPEPGTAPPRVRVREVELVQAWFSIGGDLSVGTTFTLRVGAPGGLLYYVFVAFDEGFLPLDGLVAGVEGTLLLGTSTIQSTYGGLLRDGLWTQAVTIPNLPFLVGTRLLWQAAYIPQIGRLQYLNAQAMVVQP